MKQHKNNTKETEDTILVKKKGVRHSFMHFLSFILISLFLFFSTCGKKSPNPPVRQTHQFAKPTKKKGVRHSFMHFLISTFKKGVRHSFMHFMHFLISTLKKGCQKRVSKRGVTKGVSGTLLCIFLVLS